MVINNSNENYYGKNVYICTNNENRNILNDKGNYHNENIIKI